MQTGFSLLESSSALRMHWIRRVLAGLIDIAIVSLSVRLALTAADLSGAALTAALAGAAWFLYAGLLEGRFGRTPGKWLLRLRVISLRDGRTYGQTFARSLTKLVYVLMPFDVALGLMTSGDPRRRFVDGFTRTLVIAIYPSSQSRPRAAEAGQRE